MRLGSHFLAAFILACACGALNTAQRQQIQLNQNAFRFAEELIANGHFVADKKGDWHKDKQPAQAENEFIRAHGLVEYAKWHLGTGDRHGENSKARAKFPFGDFKNVHRCALIAIRSRAREYGYFEIERAAAELQRELERKAKAAPK